MPPLSMMPQGIGYELDGSVSKKARAGNNTSRRMTVQNYWTPRRAGTREKLSPDAGTGRELLMKKRSGNTLSESSDGGEE